MTIRILKCMLVLSLNFTIMLDSIAVDAGKEASLERRCLYEEKAEALTFKDDAGKVLLYRLYTPENLVPDKTYPLIVSFHGAGERGSDNKRQLKDHVAGWIRPEVQKTNPCFVFMPQCPSDKRWVEVSWKVGRYDFVADRPSETMALAIAVFNKLLKEKPIDRTKIYVSGASMGGYGTWDFAMRHAGLLAAAVPACGGGDPNNAALLKDLPIWAFHGDKDTTVPLTGSTDMIDAIKAIGGQKAKLTIYPNVHHESWNMFWKEPEMITWLFNQSK